MTELLGVKHVLLDSKDQLFDDSLGMVYMLDTIGLFLLEPWLKREQSRLTHLLWLDHSLDPIFEGGIYTIQSASYSIDLLIIVGEIFGTNVFHLWDSVLIQIYGLFKFVFNRQSDAVEVVFLILDLDIKLLQQLLSLFLHQMLKVWLGLLDVL